MYVNFQSMMIAARGKPHSCMFCSGTDRAYLQVFKVEALIESVPSFVTTITGIGGGGIVTLTQIITSDLVPLAERGKYQGLIGMIWCLASVGLSTRLRSTLRFVSQFIGPPIVKVSP